VQRSVYAACRSASSLAEEGLDAVCELSEPEFFDCPAVKLQQIMTAGAT